MRKTLCLVTAVSALCMAAPAAAQYRDWRSYDADTSFDVRIDNLQTRLDAGVRAGTISAREAWTLRRQLSDLERLEARYSIGGFSPAESADLRARLRMARRDIRIADNGSWDRNDRFAWDDRGWDRYGRNGPYDRYDRYTGRGGPLDEVVCERRGGVIGFLEDITGTRDCFVVGQRVTFELDPVPWRYRDLYRDDRDSYFRSDGRAIYEIDARTNTVLRVHRIPRD